MGPTPRWAATLLRGSLVALMALATMAPASAQGGGNGEGRPSGGSERGGGGQPPSQEARPRPAVEDPHVLVAALRYASGGTLVIDGGRVDVPTPWSNYLAPGMWLRLEGAWEGETFRVSQFEVAQPAYFSYYLGPAAPLGLGAGWVEAWFEGTAPDADAEALTIRRTVQDRAPLALLRAVDGAWATLPAGLTPPSPTADGWTLLSGRVDAGAVRWTSARPFP